MIVLNNISKQFDSFAALNNISFTIEQGEIFGIIGASGAGKSTLLQTINLLHTPTAGTIEIDGVNLTTSNSAQVREARKMVGMIFQHFNLVLNKTVFSNVEIALKLANYPRQDRKKRVMECLQFVGLEHYANVYPEKLSGGQKQRVAIARALANKPTILLCDEPTSALDPSTTDEILTVLESINRQLGVTIIIVSHEMDVIKSICHRVAVLDKGELYKMVSITPKGINHSSNTAERLVGELTGGVSN